ncbi:DUF2218 domain-containing protein [Segnochrobactrum spirostomi]|uniref:DUF2218 domain-containing protein n=1 Tax=Segnochrobactrum spirostomi TaxID=2608987 RepID=A0A6A7Y1R6_9HYPH|nr:DUF2218 domain-containing protein [Segnochrobactrum spirostomi]MQT12903.1 DUF2218 domain-containing protein [Segnochrobactrum spirostomi]
MPVSEARIQSEYAQRYVGQLCKHFQHKLPVEYRAGTPTATGHITFEFGSCDLVGEDEILTMRAVAETEDDLRRLEDVLARHLERFAFRDNPPIVWADAA